MGLDLFGTGRKLVQINLVSAQNLVDPVTDQICYLVPKGPLMKVISYGTHRSSFEPVMCKQSGSVLKLKNSLQEDLYLCKESQKTRTNCKCKNAYCLLIELFFVQYEGLVVQTELV